MAMDNLDHIKKQLGFAFSFIAPIFVGLALVDRVDIYWAIAVAVGLGNLMTWWFAEDTFIPAFYELPEDMKGKNYDEIISMVEEEGAIIDEVHFEFIKDAKEQDSFEVDSP